MTAEAMEIASLPLLEGDPLKRYEWALHLGLDCDLAIQATLDESVDLHLAAKRLGRTAPAALAVELATPVR